VEDVKQHPLHAQQGQRLENTERGELEVGVLGGKFLKGDVGGLRDLLKE
jgi:hypothetical protein